MQTPTCQGSTSATTALLQEPYIHIRQTSLTYRPSQSSPTHYLIKPIMYSLRYFSIEQLEINTCKAILKQNKAHLHDTPAKTSFSGTSVVALQQYSCMTSGIPKALDLLQLHPIPEKPYKC